MTKQSNRSEGRRLYEHIAEALAARITSGQYGIGSRLPSERELAHSFSVSRPTIREAIIALELDGLVEVKVGSGVYVKQDIPAAGSRVPDVGPFELLEARRIVESEVCAFAATRIDDDQIRDLEQLVAEMEKENDHDISLSELADRRFHEVIAEATENSPLIGMVKSLWDARMRSPLIQRLSAKAHEAGVKPGVNEHRAILDALRARNVHAARTAMYDHLSRVIENLLIATEVEEIERAKAQVAAQRQRYAARIIPTAPASSKRVETDLAS